jgi:hypothetical protein
LGGSDPRSGGAWGPYFAKRANVFLNFATLGAATAMQ